jgi:FeS assembly SUF system protein
VEEEAKTAPERQPEDAAASPDTAGAATSGGAGAEPPAGEATRQRVIEILQTIFDPEIPVNIYELGLIYSVDLDASGVASIRMTLTSPSCPSAEMLPPLVESRARSVPGVTDVRLELVWDPPWTPAMMSEAAKLQLNMF